MFRKMRRFKQELTEEEVKEVLKNEKRGVLAVSGDNGYPYAVPLDYYYNEEENCFYFHGAGEGHKFDSVKNEPKASFCIFEKEGIKEEGKWYYHVKSVIAFGKVEIMQDPDRIKDCLYKLGMKYYPTKEGVDHEIERDLKRTTLFILHVEHMTGKGVNEK
ncbi:MAG: pyridoxamine 5'-phosphate oxidase family protein [Lachnospiraceae bacterium]|nr:pyridoxamine 5'-phosphate oxidase family protein [Lachnospiraceae bacterium]MEE3461346.1 pyridoxamine 5'-phosphate oxidase family protein [Lachnospiraceae bacterium]